MNVHPNPEGSQFTKRMRVREKNINTLIGWQARRNSYKSKKAILWENRNQKKCAFHLRGSFSVIYLTAMNLYEMERDAASMTEWASRGENSQFGRKSPGNQRLIYTRSLDNWGFIEQRIKLRNWSSQSIIDNPTPTITGTQSLQGFKKERENRPADNVSSPLPLGGKWISLRIHVIFIGPPPPPAGCHTTTPLTPISQSLER